MSTLVPRTVQPATVRASAKQAWNQTVSDYSLKSQMSQTQYQRAETVFINRYIEGNSQ